MPDLHCAGTSAALAQSLPSPRFDHFTLGGSGSTGDMSGMSVTAGGSTKALSTWFGTGGVTASTLASGAAAANLEAAPPHL